MLYLHPLTQMAAMALGLYALILAWPRARTLHLGGKAAFNRPRHVLLGKISWGLMLLGALGGALVVRLSWGGWLMTGEHAWLGLAMIPPLAFGLGSGLHLAASPKKRLALPLAHGLCNLLVLGLSVAQFISGRRILEALAVN